MIWQFDNVTLTVTFDLHLKQKINSDVTFRV